MKLRKYLRQLFCTHYWLRGAAMTDSEWHTQKMSPSAQYDYGRPVIWRCLRCRKAIIKEQHWIPLNRELD